METLKTHRLFGIENPAGKLAVAAALLLSAVSPAQAKHPSNPNKSPSVPTEIEKAPGGKVEEGHGMASLPEGGPHLRLGGQDDLLLLSDNDQAVDHALNMAKAMGYSDWRITIHPHKVSGYQPNSRHRVPRISDKGLGLYDRALDRIVSHGFTPYINFSQEKVRWTDRSYYLWVGKIAAHFHERLGETPVIIEPGGNEANYPGWLIPKHHKSLAQSAGELFAVGYKAIEKNYSTAQIVCCDLSSKPHKDKITGQKIKMTDFFHDMMEYAYKAYNKKEGRLPKDEKNLRRFVLSMVTQHGYQMTTPPDRPSRVSREQGIGSWDEIEAAIDREVAAGHIIGPDGQRMPSGVSEVGYGTDTRGLAANPKTTPTFKLRVTPENPRARYYKDMIMKGCDDIQMKVLYSYGFAAPPFQYPAEWDTALLDQAMNPLPTAVKIQQTGRKNLDCVDVPESALSLPKLVVGRPYAPN